MALDDLLGELSAVDRRVNEAIADAHMLRLDDGMRCLSRVASNSALWIGVAGAVAAAGGTKGRVVAARDLRSVAVATRIVNQGIKRFVQRRRPDREDAEVREIRYVTMPTSIPFPSGNSASAFAFTAGVGSVVPWLGLPLRATGVAFSCVNCGYSSPGTSSPARSWEPPRPVGGADGHAVRRAPVSGSENGHLCPTLSDWP